MASKLVEAGGRASVIKSEKWTKSLDFYIITHVLKSEAGNFVTFNKANDCAALSKREQYYGNSVPFWIMNLKEGRLGDFDT